MRVKWNEVTRFSQVVAIVVFIVVYLVGIYVGMQIQKKKDAQEPEWAKAFIDHIHSTGTTIPAH